ncbi:MAG TPA: YetF domain-containing protein [Sphingomonadaceae bacterium]
MTLEAIFGTKDSITWAQECARALVIFVYGLAAVRLAGRRIFARWAALDFIVSVIVGSNLSRALTGSAPLWGTLAASTLLLAVHWLLSQAVARFSWASRVLEGLPVRLVSHGELDERLRKNRSVSQADLGEALRTRGVEDVRDTRDVVLEPSGKLTVIKRR